MNGHSSVLSLPSPIWVGCDVRGASPIKRYGIRQDEYARHLPLNARMCLADDDNDDDDGFLLLSSIRAMVREGLLR